jgi:hypothetical protein
VHAKRPGTRSQVYSASMHQPAVPRHRLQCANFRCCKPFDTTSASPYEPMWSKLDEPARHEDRNLTSTSSIDQSYRCPEELLY